MQLLENFFKLKQKRFTVYFILDIVADCLQQSDNAITLLRELAAKCCRVGIKFVERMRRNMVVV